MLSFPYIAPLSSAFGTQVKYLVFTPRLVDSVRAALFPRTSLTFFSPIYSMMLKPLIPLKFGLLSGVINTPSPLWDLEYADDTPMSNCAEQITRLLHLLQSEAHIRGLTLNFDKCAHLRLRSDERVFFSPSLSSPARCHGHLAPPLPGPLSDEVKYLGVYLDSLSNNGKNVSYRVSQAMSASKLLRRFWLIVPYLHHGNSRCIVQLSSLSCFTLWKAHSLLLLSLLNSIMFISNPFDAFSVSNPLSIIEFSIPQMNVLTLIWHPSPSILLGLLLLHKYILKTASCCLDICSVILRLLSTPLRLGLLASIATLEARIG